MHKIFTLLIPSRRLSKLLIPVEVRFIEIPKVVYQ